MDNEVKHYKEQELLSQLAAEPTIAYGGTSIQSLKSSLIASIERETDEKALRQCWELLHPSEIPCCFTEEEFDEEIRLSEESGNISHQDALNMFAQWGFVK